MARRQAHHARRSSRRSRARLQFSAAIPANSIGTGAGTVLQPGERQRGDGDGRRQEPDRRQIVDALRHLRRAGSRKRARPAHRRRQSSDGHWLSIKQGRPFVAGRADGQAAAFVKVSQPGPLTVLVSGGHHSTGTYSLDVTLAGDVNGDGTVNQADLAPFAAAYLTTAGEPEYNAAADFNQNGIVNQDDAKALEQNMPPSKPGPLNLVMNLLPADQAHYRRRRTPAGRHSSRTSRSSATRCRAAS